MPSGGYCHIHSVPVNTCGSCEVKNRLSWDFMHPYATSRLVLGTFVRAHTLGSMTACLVLVMSSHSVPLNSRTLVGAFSQPFQKSTQISRTR